jgi:hypothetical protein
MTTNPFASGDRMTISSGNKAVLKKRVYPYFLTRPDVIERLRKMDNPKALQFRLRHG